jgi:hypothetical protein
MELTRSVLVSTLAHVKLSNNNSHIYRKERLLGMYNRDLKRDLHKKSPCINNRKMIPGQKVHIVNRPVIS